MKAFAATALFAASCAGNPAAPATTVAARRIIAEVRDVSPAPDAGIAAAPPSPAGIAWDTFVPPLDAATIEHVRRTFGRGAAAGQRADVFAKLGDSITESGSFAQDIGHGWYELGAHTALEPVVRWFSRRRMGAPDDNAFTRASGAATAGWDAGQLLEGGDRSPLEHELAATRPAFAVIMIGTNDAERRGETALAEHLEAALDRIEHRDVVAIVSTIPPRSDDPSTHAAADAIAGRIRSIAQARHLPLVDLHAAFARLPSMGLSDDGVHPSVFVDHGDTRAAVFTSEGLRYGYNVRNLLLLYALRRVLDATGIAYAASG